jgi:hypothetical protein
MRGTGATRRSVSFVVRSPQMKTLTTTVDTVMLSVNVGILMAVGLGILHAMLT